MTSMRQVWRALPGPNTIKCECCMSVLPIFPALLWLLGRPHDVHDADDAGSWGAGRLRRAVNPNKTFKVHAVGNSQLGPILSRLESN